MIRYMWFLVSSICMFACAADRDNSNISVCKFPSLADLAQKAIARDIISKKDSLITQLNKTIRVEREISFEQAIKQVEQVDTRIRTLLSTLLVAGSESDFFNSNDLMSGRRDLSDAFDELCSGLVRRNQSLSCLFGNVVGSTYTFLDEKTFDEICNAFTKLPFWASAELIDRLNLVSGYKYIEAEYVKSMGSSLFDVHIDKNHFFVSGCFDTKNSSKVESIALMDEQKHILKGNDYCVTRFASRDDFLFGLSPYKQTLYDDICLYIWNLRLGNRCQEFKFPGTIAGVGLNDGYCTVVDSLGVINCLRKKKVKYKKLFDKCFFCRPVHFYQVCGDTYAYSSDDALIVGSLDYSGASLQISKKVTTIPYDVSKFKPEALFFLSDTELLACQSDALLYIIIDDDLNAIACDRRELRSGYVDKGRIAHGKFIYPSQNNSRLYVYDPRMNEYDTNLTHSSYEIDIFALGSCTLLGYDKMKKSIWRKQGCSEMETVLVALLAKRKKYNLELLLGSSDIVRKQWDETSPDKDEKPLLLRILASKENKAVW